MRLHSCIQDDVPVQCAIHPHTRADAMQAIGQCSSHTLGALHEYYDNYPWVPTFHVCRFSRSDPCLGDLRCGAPNLMGTQAQRLSTRIIMPCAATSSPIILMDSNLLQLALSPTCFCNLPRLTDVRSGHKRSIAFVIMCTVRTLFAVDTPCDRRFIPVD